jgi:hypothetical protein
VRSAPAAFAASALTTARLVIAGRLIQPGRHVGLRVDFADGTRGRVYRETLLRDGPSTRPSLLVVQFRLRGLGRSRLLHALFRLESMANTPLFAGFPGFRSKLWLAGDGCDTYRGIYDWDGPTEAEAYATTLARLLRPICRPGSVRHHVEAGVRRDDAVYHPELLGSDPVPDDDRWWRPLVGDSP